MSSTQDPLSRFSRLTAEWFNGTFVVPTDAQAQAWSAIADGDNTLVVAPTGSGKTLAAFLWAIDRLAAEPRPPGTGTRVLYVSPLKALAVDVERNLRTPLTGITRIAERRGLPAPEISVGVRSGDTPPGAQAGADHQTARHPDHHTRVAVPDADVGRPRLARGGADRDRRRGARRRRDQARRPSGALARAAGSAVWSKPAQRIGLSATVRPPEEVARFLSGQAPTTIVAPPAAKTFDLSVQVPVPDMANLENNSIWPDVEERIVDLIEAHRSSIVFANSRRLAERLTSRLNEIHAERNGIELQTGPNPQVGGGSPAHIMGSGLASGAAPLLAQAHHGSVSKEQRALVEDDLKTGRLKAVVATSSLELGIDMGAVDLVIQVETPPSVASGLQRIGRAGHQVGEISQGVLFPKHRTDLIGCAVTVRRMLAGEIETMRVPTNPLDVLAQHTVAACALEPLDADLWFDAVRRSAPFATLPRSAFEATLDLLSGKYPSTEFAELRPRLVYDRDAGTLTARPGAQRLAVTSGGAIPDRGLFTVYLASSADSEKPSRVGELDEEMVYESRPGDVISLGATSWRITEITHDRVLVIPAPGQPARLPFWRGDGVGRPAELGAAIGAFTGELAGLDRETFDERCARNGFRRLRDRQPVAAARRPAPGHRHGAHRRHLGRRAVPRRARRLAGDPALPLRAAGARPAGAGGVATAARALRHRREADRLRRRHHRAAAGHRGRRARAPTCSSSTPTRSSRSSPPRSAARRCSRPGSANAPPAPCCCRAATPASGRRCGISGSARRNCSTSRASTRTSRSCSRRSANACRTSTTCRR